MTIANLPNNLYLRLSLIILLIFTAAQAEAEENTSPRRALTYREALAAAGDDGIIIYRYGPDWNQRSVRMLKSFWRKSEVEEATGQAILLELPQYQEPTAAQRAEQMRISDGVRRYFGKKEYVCPAILFADRDGEIYAELAGMDDLGDESGGLAIQNIREKLDLLHRRQELMKRADAATGEERARLLIEVSDLPIEPPPDIKTLIEQADPEDKLGGMRRLDFSARSFIYEQLGTTSGFLPSVFRPDYDKIRKECLKVINDKALRPADKQKVYSMLIGLSLRENITGRPLKKMLEDCAKMDTTTLYGKISPTLALQWSAIKIDAQTRRQSRRDNKKEEKEDKKRARNINIK